MDAGCGLGYVAAYLASKDLRVYGIDIIQNHVDWARQNIRSLGLQTSVAIDLMDYRNLDKIFDKAFDGVYTMEKLVDATDPKKALRNFFRILRPGGSIALYEYEHSPTSNSPEHHGLCTSIAQINRWASMPANQRFRYGVLQSMLKECGFDQIILTDLSENIRPMLYLFYIVAYLPFLLIRLLGLEAWFINAYAGVIGYQVMTRGLCRYVAVTAQKPQLATA